MFTRLALSAVLALTFGAGLRPFPALEATHMAAVQTAALPDQHERSGTPGEPEHGVPHAQSTQHMMMMHEQIDRTSSPRAWEPSQTRVVVIRLFVPCFAFPMWASILFVAHHAALK
jgi:hypothetical protein